MDAEMKCQVKELIEYLSGFTLEDEITLANYSGEACIYNETRKAFILYEDEACPKFSRNKSKEYLEGNYAD